MRLAQPGNHVIAVDLATGREVWSWYHNPAAAALCCGLVNRGVAVYGDKVYVGTLDAHLVALDRRTGAMVWDTQVEGTDPAQGYSFSMAPLAAGGKILIGTSGGEFSIRGFLDAYDPETGRRLWRFYTIPSPEEGGWWGRLHDDHARRRRPPAGYRPGASRQRGLRRLAGSAAADRCGLRPPTIPSWGSSSSPSATRRPGTGRPPGDNLYTSSLAAVDIATGKLRWYYQMIPHNMWDFDPPAPRC